VNAKIRDNRREGIYPTPPRFQNTFDPKPTKETKGTNFLSRLNLLEFNQKEEFSWKTLGKELR